MSLDASQFPLKPTLRPAKLRISRAGVHLNVIETALKDARERRTDGEVIIQTNADFTHPVINWSSAPKFPTVELGIIAGEVLYNIRAALDYLVFSLSWLDDGQPQEKTQFPIESKEEVFWQNRRNTYLLGVNDEHVALIERLQPFKGCNGQVSFGISPIQTSTELLRLSSSSTAEDSLRPERTWRQYPIDPADTK